MDFHILETHADKSKLLVAALRKNIISEVINFFESCQIFPTIVELDILSLLHAASIEDEFLESPGVLLLKVEEKVCNVLYLQYGKIIDWRNIQLSFTSVSEALMVDMDETAELNLDVLEKNELFPKVAFDGVSEKNKSLCTVPIGLATKMITQTKEGYNFRKGEFVYDKSFDIVKKPLAIAISFLVFFLAIGTWQLRKTALEKRKQYQVILTKAEKMRKELKLPKTSSYWNQVYTLKKNIKKRIDVHQKRKALQIKDSLKRWAALFEKISYVRKRFYFTIEKLSIDQNEAYISGKAKQIIFFDLFKKELEKIVWIAKVDLVQQRKTKNRNLTYSYKCWVQFKKALQ